MTIREAISKVKKSFKEINADSHLSNKFVYSSLVAKSNLIMQRESDALRLSNIQDVYQTLKCVKVEEIPSVDPRCNMKSKAKFYRTVKCLPDTYFDSDGPLIRSIRSIDGFTEIQLTTLDSIERWKKDSNSKYDKSVYAFYSEKHLYLTRKVPVKIEAAFTNDISHIDCNCDDIPCYVFLDTKWYVPKKLEDTILSLVLQDLANSYERVSTKVLTDKNDNT